MATYYVDVSGFPQAAAAIIGEGPATGGVPTTARLGIVNALAPTAVYYHVAASVAAATDLLCVKNSIAVTKPARID